MTFPNIQRLLNCPYRNNIKQTFKCLSFAVMSPPMPKPNLHPWFFNQGKRCCQWPSVLCEPICSKRASAKNITVVSPALYIQQTANKILSQMINGTSPKGHLQDDVNTKSQAWLKLRWSVSPRPPCSGRSPFPEGILVRSVPHWRLTHLRWLGTIRCFVIRADWVSPQSSELCKLTTVGRYTRLHVQCPVLCLGTGAKR